MHAEAQATQQRILSDYRLALGLELRARRDAARYTLPELSTQTGVPLESLRSYEKGGSRPQIMTLAKIGSVYNTSALDILVATAQYIYRANGEPIPDSNVTSVDKIALRAVILYCGVAPTQLPLVELSPPQRRRT